MHIKIKKGLDVPVDGRPELTIHHDADPVSSVGLVGRVERGAGVGGGRVVASGLCARNHVQVEMSCAMLVGVGNLRALASSAR